MNRLDLILILICIVLVIASYMIILNSKSYDTVQSVENKTQGSLLLKGLNTFNTIIQPTVNTTKQLVMNSTVNNKTNTLEIKKPKNQTYQSECKDYPKICSMINNMTYSQSKMNNLLAQVYCLQHANDPRVYTTKTTVADCVKALTQ